MQIMFALTFTGVIGIALVLYVLVLIIKDYFDSKKF